MAGSEAEERLRALAEKTLRTMYPGARIIHELTLYQGGPRIDLAAVMMDHIVAVEIKSERDTLKRATHQLNAAIKIAARTWLCVAHEHVAEADALLTKYEHDNCLGARVSLYAEEERRTKTNAMLALKHMAYDRDPILEPFALLNMLWADELRRVIGRAGSKIPRTGAIKMALEFQSGRQIRRAAYRELGLRDFPRADPPIVLAGADDVSRETKGPAPLASARGD